MFDELCRTGRTHELATIHRFRHRWEQAASLQLRSGKPDALDAYFKHGRVSEGSFDDLAADAARHWIEHTAAGRSVAVVAETNEDVDSLNRAIREQRRTLGQLSAPTARVAGSETASVGDVVTTRRNDRSLRTERGEPVRNRDRWTVVDVGRHGSVTVSHLQGHGQVTLPANYARASVRLGYAATTHGYQGDTVDIGIAVATAATSHRSLYVGATRGRQENRLFVVTDEPDQARDVLEQILANDRADIPAVARRRQLVAQLPGARRNRGGVRSAEDSLAAARRLLDETARRAEPFLHPLREAEADLRTAENDLRASRRALADAPRRRRRGLAQQVGLASDVVAEARERLNVAQREAVPSVAEIDAATALIVQAEGDASTARIRERLDRLSLEPPVRSIERGHGIDPPSR